MTDAELDKLLARLTPQELAELDGLLAAPEPETFNDFLWRVTPRWRWEWPHLQYIIKRVQKWIETPNDNLIVVAPIRHGKSELLTVRLPVYGLTRDPTSRWIFGGYSATFARFHALKARRIARQIGMPLSNERDAVNDWGTTSGGGMFSVGVGEGVTGRGGDNFIVDDPVKSREEAESETYREKTWQWFTDDLMSRKEPGARTLVTMARWHEDDLVGRILASEFASEWDILHLPALAEDNDPLGRTPGEPLCPDRMNLEALVSARKRGEYAFASLFQGHPIPRSGGMFPASGPVIVDAVPPNLRGIRWWDYAGTTDGGAYTAGTLMAFANGLVYVLDVQRFQKAALERDRLVRQTAETDRAFGHVSYWLEQEPGSAGKDAASHFVRLLAGFNAHAQPATGDKVTRAEDSGWAAQWQAGNVRLLRGDWNQAYIREHASFPSGKFKDQVDSSVGAFTKLARAPLMASPIESLTKASYWTGA